MTTVRDIVLAAYRKINGAGHEVTGDEFAYGLEAFNFMVHGWKAKGVNIFDRDDTFTDGFPDPFSNDRDFVEADEFPMPSAFREGTVYTLATAIAPEWSAPVSWDAEAFFRTLQANYQNVPDAAFDSILLYRLPRVWL